MCFHPHPLPVPNSQVMTQGRRRGGALEGKRAWIPKNIKSQAGPGQRSFCCATLDLPSTMVMPGGPCQLCSPGAWDRDWHPEALLKPLRA